MGKESPSKVWEIKSVDHTTQNRLTISHLKHFLPVVFKWGLNQCKVYPNFESRVQMKPRENPDGVPTAFFVYPSPTLQNEGQNATEMEWETWLVNPLDSKVIYHTTVL